MTFLQVSKFDCLFPQHTQILQNSYNIHTTYTQHTHILQHSYNSNLAASKKGCWHWVVYNHKCPKLQLVKPAWHDYPIAVCLAIKQTLVLFIWKRCKQSSLWSWFGDIFTQKPTLETSLIDFMGSSTFRGITKGHTRTAFKRRYFLQQQKMKANHASTCTHACLVQ